MDKSVTSILQQKGDWVITTHRSATILDTIERMVEHNVGAIVVTDRGEIEGIFTERDYLRRVTLKGRAAESTRIHDVMTSEVVTVTPDTTIRECMATMTQRRCRHLPVERDGHLAGIVSIGDCVKELFSTAEVQVQELTQYISGAYPR